MHVVVEGESDKATASRMVEFAGRHVLHVTVTRGKTKLDSKLANYSRAARDQPWVVFRDSDNQCPVSLRRRLLAGIPDNPLFALRIVHTMTEAWLMADRLGFSRYFAVSFDTVPVDPEAKPHAPSPLPAQPQPRHPGRGCARAGTPGSAVRGAPDRVRIPPLERFRCSSELPVPSTSHHRSPSATKGWPTINESEREDAMMEGSERGWSLGTGSILSQARGVGCRKGSCLAPVPGQPHPTQSQRADPTNGPGHHTRTSLCSCCS